MTQPLPCLPTDRDVSASLTALAMGEYVVALDLIAGCNLDTHHRRADGSCRCGLHTATKIVKRVV